MNYLIEETPTADWYESAYWTIKIEYSNRYANQAIFYGGSSDKGFSVPTKRVETVIQKLKQGENPDEIAKSFPIEW